MSAPKLTQWFPGDVRPARIGVYERNFYFRERYLRALKFAFWNGEFWSPCQLSKDEAIFMSRSAYQLNRLIGWRGLAQDPKARS